MKVNVTKRAQKEYRCTGCGGTIAVGETYYYWQHMYSPMQRHCQKCGYPKPSQLASSDKVQRYLAAQESIEEAASTVANADAESLAGAVEELISAMQDAAEELRSVAEEYNESADNMENAFTSGSSVIDQIRENATTLESWADNIDNAVSTLEGIDLTSTQCDSCNGTGVDEDGGECQECNGSGDTLDGIRDEIQAAIDDAMSETL